MTDRLAEVFVPRWLEYEPPSAAHFIGVGSLIGGAISGLGSLAGGLFGSSAATDAARIQSNATTQAAQLQAQTAQQAMQLQMQMFQQMQSNLGPWLNTGQSELSNLVGMLPDLINPTSYGLSPGNFFASNVPYGVSTPGGYGGQAFTPIDYGLGGSSFRPTDGFSFAPTMENLRSTPGYQFALDQGLAATANQNASMGLSGSGAMGRGLINYAEGLASTTYQNQFNNWLQTLQTQSNIFSGNLAQQYGMFSGNIGQQYGIWGGQNQLALGRAQQTYNMLGGLAGSGQNAAVNTGTAGLNAATQSGNFLSNAAGQAGNLLTSGAAATAGGIIGSNNALFSGFSNAGSGIQNSLMNYAMINALGGGNAGGSAIANIFGGSAAVGSGGPSASGTGGLY